jgi:hypothetical protein
MYVFLNIIFLKNQFTHYFLKSSMKICNISIGNQCLDTFIRIGASYLLYLTTTACNFPLTEPLPPF